MNLEECSRHCRPLFMKHVLARLTRPIGFFSVETIVILENIFNISHGQLVSHIFLKYLLQVGLTHTRGELNFMAIEEIDFGLTQYISAFGGLHQEYK